MIQQQTMAPHSTEQKSDSDVEYIRIVAFEPDPEEATVPVPDDRRIKTRIELLSDEDIDDLPDDALLYIHIPRLNNSTFPITQCIFYKGTLERLLNLEGFNPTKQIKDSTPPVYRIGPSPTGGQGMFAEKTIEIGDLIIAERGLIIAPWIWDIILENGSIYSNMQKLQAILEIPYNRMSDSKRDAIRNLYQNPSINPKFHLAHKWNTNAYTCDHLDALTHNSSLHLVVFEKMSKINHSCMPNCSTPTFDLKTFSHQIRATKRIEQGHEILGNYVCPLENSAAQKRRTKLSKYNFTCTCDLCKSSDKTDKTLATLQDEIKEIWSEESERKIYYLCLEVLDGMKLLHIDGLEDYYLVMKRCLEACGSLINDPEVDYKETLKIFKKADDLDDVISAFERAHYGDFK